MVSGKEFRASLSRPLPNAPQHKGCRLVPAFTVQSLQKGTCVLPPPRSNPFQEQPSKTTQFKTSYKRGDFPIALEAKGTSIIWKVSTNIAFRIFYFRNDPFKKSYRKKILFHLNPG